MTDNPHNANNNLHTTNTIAADIVRVHNVIHVGGNAHTRAAQSRAYSYRQSVGHFCGDYRAAALNAVVYTSTSGDGSVIYRKYTLKCCNACLPPQVKRHSDSRALKLRTCHK